MTIERVQVAQVGAGGSTVVSAADSTITIGGTPTAPTVGVNAIPESKVTNLVSDLAGKAATVHAHVESDVTGLVADLAARQPLDSDLTAIAAIAPANDDVVQRKSGAWTNRTMAQVKTDLALTESDIAGLLNDMAAWGFLTSGEATMPRTGISSGQAVASGTLNLTYFTARKTETITQVRVPSGGTAAGATPTLCRVGIYSEAGNGDLTLVASIASDTALWAATSTEYLRSFTASLSKVAGQRYALGLIVVSAAALPTFYQPTSPNSAIHGTIMARAPRLAGLVAGQTDLPSSVVAASITNGSPRPVYAELVP